MAGGVVTITSNADKVAKALAKFPQQTNQGLRRVFVEQGNQGVAALVRVTTRNLHRRSGALARGWTKRVEGSAKTNLVLIFVNEVPYAVTHEEGATITPKRRSFLAIPLSAAKTASGVARVSPGDLPRRQSFVRNRIVFFKSSANDQNPTPMFALKKSVRIPPRLNAEGVFIRQAKKLERAIEKEIENIFNRGK